jgi:hypothetical protein
MARKFLGSNSQTRSRNLFNSRAKYRNYAISSRLIEDNPGIFRNFWFIENMYYGRIDPVHRTVVAKRSKMKTISGTDGTSVVVFDFVANAFQNFLKDHEKAAATSKIRKNDSLNEISAKKGYQDPLSAYDLHFTSLAAKVLFKLKRNHSRINNFEDYVTYFLDYLYEIEKDSPITFTGFMASRFSSPLTTGLFIDLSKANYGEDAAKITDFIDAKNFNFFVKNCEKHGFMIDKNIPWRLCANVGSAEMDRYMSDVDTSFDSLFDDYYERPYEKDMKYFMDYMLKYYNRFIAIKPHVRKEVIKDGEMYRYIIKRKQETKRTMNQKYDINYRSKLYVDLRNRETANRYDQAYTERIKANATQMAAIDSSGAVFDYIDKSFKGFLNDIAAHNGVKIIKSIKKKQEDYDGQELERVLKASVSESRKTIY